MWGEPTELNREFNSCTQRVVGSRSIVLKGCWLYILRLFSFCIYAFSHAPVQKLIKKAGMQPHFLFPLYSPLSSIFVSPCHHHQHHPSPPLSSACCLLHPVLGSRACLVFLDHRGLILAEVCLEGTKRRRDCLEFQCVCGSVCSMWAARAVLICSVPQKGHREVISVGFAGVENGVCMNTGLECDQ